jgi:Rrf2 family protein
MLSQTAEYALRAMAVLASSQGQLVPTTDIAQLGDVPPPYLAKVLQQLAASGLIRGRRGVGGGYMLAQPAGQIMLFDVVAAVSNVRATRTAEEVSTLQDGLSALHLAIDSAAGSVLQVLRGVSLADVAQDRAAVRLPEADVVVTTQPTADAFATAGKNR